MQDRQENADRAAFQPPVDATASVTVAADRMTAEITLSPPGNGGRPPDEALLREALRQKGVVAGLMEDVIAGLAARPVYAAARVVAQGVRPQAGLPAGLTYRIRTEQELRPREREDGTVDYKDLGLVQNVAEGQVLCVKTPATAATPGFNVLGAALSAPSGRDLPMPVGKNTRLSEDKLSLLAACAGQADVTGGKVQVQSTYTVEGDVCHATGNIRFVGNVVVRGNVLSGFAVSAEGNIEVHGSVESAELTAGGSILVKEGINGMGKGLVSAGGNVRAKYIQAGNVRAGGDVETDFILNSSVQSGRTVRMLGSKAALVGGRVTALHSVEAAVVGGRNSPVPTTVEVGNDPTVLTRSREIPQEIARARKDIAALERAVDLFAQYERAGRLDDEKRQALRKASDACELLRQRVGQLELELEAATETLAHYGYGVLKVRQSLFPGVRVVIGTVQMLAETTYDHCVFTRVSETEIRTGPYR